MNKFKLLLLALAIATISHAQTTIDSLGNYHLTKGKRGSEATKTGKFAYDSEGTKHEVYLSKNGKLFVKMVSKKTNKVYNKYLN